MEYYYDGQWRSYEYLHNNYGITLEPATPIYVYDYELNEYQAWIDESDTNQPVWVVRDSTWCNLSDLDYWLKLDSKYDIFLIGDLLHLDTYKKHSNEMYCYDGSLYTYLYMHNNFGMTLTPSTIYSISEGVVTCWYNPDIDMYWDVETTQWYNFPPGQSDNLNSVGSTGTFLYSSKDGTPTHYGSIISADRLTPMCINFPESGEVSCTKFKSLQITGTWKILTETGKSSDDNRCIVTAIKISNNEYIDENNNTEHNSATDEQPTNNTQQPLGNYNITETIEYDL